MDKLLDGRKLAKEKEIQNLSILNSLLEKKRQLTKFEKPDIVNQVNLITKDLEHLKEKLTSLYSEQNPYICMLDLLQKELENNEIQVASYKNELKELEDKMPYYDFWVKAFGDNGIREYIIDSIIPSLNSRINYWLGCLMEGKIQLHFNNQLEEKIERIPIDKDPFVYNSLSGGEVSRISLAIAQSFSHIIMMSAGICPSLIILDEVGRDLDRQGILSVYNMITEISKERQVLVITHDPDLLSLLENNCDTINVIKQNGITRIQN